MAARKTLLTLVVLVILLFSIWWLMSSGGQLAPEPNPAISPTATAPIADIFCTQEFNPVCGEDGKTYGNACEAEQQAGVEIAHEGVCYN